MTFTIEFPDYPASDMPKLPSDFVDVSWRNDSCPCFLSKSRGLFLFVDYVDADRREIADSPRFGVKPSDSQGCMPLTDSELFSSDDWQSVLHFLDNYTGPIRKGA